MMQSPAGGEPSHPRLVTLAMVHAARGDRAAYHRKIWLILVGVMQISVAVQLRRLA